MIIKRAKIEGIYIEVWRVRKSWVLFRRRNKILTAELFVIVAVFEKIIFNKTFLLYHLFILKKKAPKSNLSMI